MNVAIGNTKNDKNNLIKDFTIVKEFTAILKTDTSIITPTLILNNLTIEELTQCNYCYIAELKRYYFVKNINLNANNTISIDCEVDVLNSFKEEILLINGTVKRAENLSNGYIIDSEYKALSYSNIVTKKFPNAMTQDSFILMTVG